MTESPLIENSLDEHNNHGTTNLVCHWNHCLKVFPNHASLASHLSEDHVGWKKGGYFCDWSNCARQGAKCHNRFALMMHLRIHTGEKPFECNFPNCGQTFGRMDALVRHKKAEHGEGSLEKPTKPISAPIIAASSMSTLTPSPIHNTANLTTTTTTTTTINNSNNNNTNKYNKKIPKTLDTLSKKRARHGKKSRNNNRFYSSGEESDNDTSLPTTVEKPQKSLLSTGSADYHQYRLAKAQLHYILRENEMLQDEFDMAQKKLKRMRTERRVLLDAVMSTEKLRHGRLRVQEEQEPEQVDSYEHSIPIDQAP